MSKLNCISAPGCRALFLALLLLGMLAPTALMAQANVQGQWSTLPALMPINPVHVALLPLLPKGVTVNKVLIIAGSGNCPPSQGPPCPAGPPYGPSNNSGAAIYDPAAGTFTQFTLASDFFCNGMVLLPDGRAFIDGGTLQYDPFHGLTLSSIFDPATSTITSPKNMAHGRWYPTVTTLGNGQVMTFSGLDENGNTNKAVEIYTVGSGWSPQQLANWTPPLYPWLHLLPSGNVFYSGASPSSALYNPSTATWTLNVAKTKSGSNRVYGSSVLLPLTPTNNYDPKVMILGGNSPATATTEIIDLGAPSPTWQFGPNMSMPRIEMDAVILPNGKILAMGGSANDEDASTASLNADLYDPATNTFSSAGANVYPRLYHTVALLLPDATVWLAGGNPGRGTYESHMEVYKPAYLFQSDGTPAIRPSISSAPSSISWGSPFTVQTPDAANIGSVVLVRHGASTHSFNMDQRMVGMSFTAGSGALTVTAPPNSNIAPPGYYMLFILNTSGVPSVAKELTVTSGSPDFSLSATPSTQSVVSGGSTTYTVTVTPSGGFSGSVTFSASGLPSGASASFSPLTVSGSGSTTMTVTTASGTPTGTYPLTITGSSGTLSHSATVNLMVTSGGGGGGSIAGSVTTVSTAVNLTSLGTGDWAHWYGYDHKASGGGQISNFSLIGPGAASNYPDDPRAISWTDGTPTASATNNNGVFVAGIGSGFSITAPADTTTKTVHLYVGGWQSGGKLVAHLSDSSSPDFVDTTPQSGSGQYDGNYTITYHAASSGQTLTLKWTQNSGPGNVTLNAATLH